MDAETQVGTEGAEKLRRELVEAKARVERLKAEFRRLHAARKEAETLVEVDIGSWSLGEVNFRRVPSC